MTVLAFDLGGTRIKAALVRDDELAEPVVRDAPREGGADAIFRALEDLGREVCAGARPEGARLDGVGLAVPGLVAEDGRVSSLPGKLEGIVGQDLPGWLQETFAAPAVVLNDAIAYGIGEASVSDARRAVVMTIGTGVGVTVVEDGRPLGRGELGGGLMGGFIPIADGAEGPLDSNGHPDTVEAHCRAERLLHECGDAYGTVEDALAACLAGDRGAIEGVEHYRRHLATAIVALANAHGPDVVIVGGGPIGTRDASGRSPLLEGLEERVNERLFAGYRVRVQPASLGDAAALRGLARRLQERSTTADAPRDGQDGTAA